MANFFSKLFKSKPQTTSQVSTTSPLQDQILQMLLQGIGGEGALGGALGGFDPEQIRQLFETGVGDPARQRFQERTLPGLEQRAIASGLNRSSGLQSQMGQAQGDLEQQLNQLLAQQQLGAQEAAFGRQLSGIGAILGTPQTETLIQPGQQSPFATLLGGLAGGAGQALGGFASRGFSR